MLAGTATSPAHPLSYITIPTSIDRALLLYPAQPTSDRVSRTLLHRTQRTWMFNSYAYVK